MKLKGLLVGIMILFTLGFIFSTAESSAAEKLDFYLNWSTPYADHIAVYVASKKGYFEEQGLDVKIQFARGSNACVKVIGAKKGNLALGIADSLAVLKGIIRGVPITSITAVYQSNPTAIISLKKNSLVSMNDLVGKSLADSPTSSTYYFIKAGLAKANLDFNQVKFLAVENKAKEALLMTGKTDAMGGMANGQAVNIMEKGFDVNLITMADMGIEGYGMCIIANRSILKEKAVLDKFMAAYAKAIRYQRENPDEAASLFQKEVPLKTLSIVKKKNRMDIKLMESDDALKNGFGHQTRAAWSNLQNILYDNKVIEKKIDAEQFFTNEFVKEAAKNVF
jgi:NitT/TauT family transport system substrate-binding protein